MSEREAVVYLTQDEMDAIAKPKEGEISPMVGLLRSLNLRNGDTVHFKVRPLPDSGRERDPG